MLKITLVAGARPNFMKIAPIIKAIESVAPDRFNYRLVHTGQHYDKKMSKVFFEELDIPEPDVNLESGSGTQAEQTASIMIRFERELMQNRSDLVIVVGDVTSTLACSITAKKLNVPVAHVEGGIRSGDMSMPEEINRMVTDSISDYFFTTSELAGENLINNGITKEKILFVGNTMIDSLLSNLERLEKPPFWDSEVLEKSKYIVMTLHRPNNVDDIKNLNILLNEISTNSNGVRIVFPVHPRTRKNMDLSKNGDILIVEPLSYLEFIYLIKNSMGVITDSGGITEETTVLGIPCITLRDNTERPETVELGTNELIGTDPTSIGPWLKKMISRNWKKGGIPDLWDGKTSERIVEELIRLGDESKI